MESGEGMEMKLSPGQIQIILHHFTRGDKWPHPDTDWYKDSIKLFIREGLFNELLISTEKCSKFVEMLCNTPFPKLTFIDPRFEEIK